MFAKIKRIDKLKELKEKLEVELKTPELPIQRRTEVESYLYYVNTQIDYIEGRKELQ